jgi:hypothetical protein
MDCRAFHIMANRSSIPRARMGGRWSWSPNRGESPTQNPAEGVSQPCDPWPEDRRVLRWFEFAFTGFAAGAHGSTVPVSHASVPPNHQWLLKGCSSRCGRGIEARARHWRYREVKMVASYDAGKAQTNFRGALEQILAESVRTSDPECEAFIGVLIERFVPVPKGGPNWVGSEGC